MTQLCDVGLQVSALLNHRFVTYPANRAEFHSHLRSGVCVCIHQVNFHLNICFLHVDIAKVIKTKSGGGGGGGRGDGGRWFKSWLELIKGFDNKQQNSFASIS